jgi:carboxymethylenebutenolidase
MLDRAAEIRCTVLFHFGGQDPYIPREQAEQVCAFARNQSNMECHIHLDAGHAFDNHEAPMFHQPEPAGRAWVQTVDFLARTLPA